MAGLEFNRQAFVPSETVQPRSAIQLLTPVLLVLALALVGYVGYKVILVNVQNNSVASATERIERLQQQVAEMQRQLEVAEKHRKTFAAPPSVPEPEPKISNTAPSSHTIYRIATASAFPAQAKDATVPAAPSAALPVSPANSAEVAANHEAWEATTNRLADVVGVVGTQQGEITATRDALNELLTESRRQAVSFELDKGINRVPVGPVILQFKSVDTKAQRYTVCVIFNQQKCIELKDRALNEVVVFVVARNSAPLELIATRIEHDQIAGYLEIPSSMH
jgi:cytoskeletal protein RodZ